MLEIPRTQQSEKMMLKNINIFPFCSISSDDDDDDDDVITNHLNELTIDGVSEEPTSLRGGERISDRVNHPAGSPTTQLPNIMHHNHHLSREESHGTNRSFPVIYKKSHR